MDDLSEESLIRAFDQLVEEEVIVYGPHEVVEFDCGGYPIEVRISPSLTKKPQKPNSTLSSSFDKGEKWGPGSDMYSIDTRLAVARPNDGTHILTLNLFCVDRPQLVMLTSDSYRRQHEQLDIDDFSALKEVDGKLGESMYFIFNCGEKAGCSRIHKHIQGLRGPPRAFDHFLQKPQTPPIVPFQFFTHQFQPSFTSTPPSDILSAYNNLLSQSRKALGIDDPNAKCPHNVILWRDWMIVIPRRKATVGKVSANAAGMMGSIWVSDRELVDEVEAGVDLREVLVELGVPWE